MQKLILALSLILSGTAMANTLECTPYFKNGAGNGIATKAFFDKEQNMITVILKSSQAVSESLVDASNIVPGALTLSEAVTTRLSLSVTVMPSAGRIYVVVAPFMHMGLAQQLLCK
jgi:hypothetical protein